MTSVISRPDDYLDPGSDQGSDPVDSYAPVLVVQLAASESQSVLQLSGDFIWSSVAAFDAQLDQLVCSPLTSLVIDADGLRMIDTVGIGRLTVLHRYVVARGGRMSIICANETVASALLDSDLRAVVFA